MHAEAAFEETVDAEVAFEGSDVPEAPTDAVEAAAEVTGEEAPTDAPTEENIVIEKEAVTDFTENIIIPTEGTETTPPAVTTTDEAAANAAAEYPTEPTTEPASTLVVETDHPILTEAAPNAQAEPIEEATRTTDEVPMTNGTYRNTQNSKGRGGQRGGFRGRGEYRGDGYRPRGDYRGGYRGEHRGGGEGRGSYGGGRGDRGGYRGRGEGYSGGRGGGYRGRGGFQQNPQQQQPQAQGV